MTFSMLNKVEILDFSNASLLKRFLLCTTKGHVFKSGLNLDKHLPSQVAQRQNTDLCFPSSKNTLWQRIKMLSYGTFSIAAERGVVNLHASEPEYI